MKEKRKQSPINLKRYWLIFGLLAIVLLIPFRLVGYWMLTNLIYLSISVMVGIALLRYVRRYGWKHWIVLLMLFVVSLPVLQVYQNPSWINCTHEANNSILRKVSCSEGCDTEVHMLALGDTAIAVQTYFGRYFPYCLT
jgi:hypothetical protein